MFGASHAMGGDGVQTRDPRITLESIDIQGALRPEMSAQATEAAASRRLRWSHASLDCQLTASDLAWRCLAAPILLPPGAGGRLVKDGLGEVLGLAWSAGMSPAGRNVPLIAGEWEGYVP